MAQHRLKPANGDIAGGTSARPGAALKALRMQRGWTLAEVSKRTGMPISTLSKIENDRMSLSYDKLARLSAGLEVDIAELFGPRAAIVSGGVPSGRRSVTRGGEGHAIETENYSHIYPASDVLNKRFVPIIAEPHARTLEEFGELIRHPGEEYAYVIEGTVAFHTELYAPVVLNKGDSIYFDSGMGHAYLAVGPGPCRVLSICSGAESQIIAAMGGDRQPAKGKPSARRSPAGTRRKRTPA
jgi:transcriptional regulator with XRE-family HTH domain